jgi:hypothetical protein
MRYLFLFLSFCFCAQLAGQSFVNGDLEGTFSSRSPGIPDWPNVPYDDTVCEANEPGKATPNLTSIDKPDADFGICGKPYSGQTFCSGIHGGSPSQFFHEGIMQEVDSLVPGVTYVIEFYQSVVKQANCLDRSGSWEVYTDDQKIDVTDVTTSNEKYNSVNLKWEKRTVTFTASKKTHWIKFLPRDDDTNYGNSNEDVTGCLRMGIDHISLSTQYIPGMQLAASSIAGHVSVFNSSKDKVKLEVYDPSGKLVIRLDPMEPGVTEVDLSAQPAGDYRFWFTIRREYYVRTYTKD